MLVADSMIRGLYRTTDRLLGNSVRVHWSAGDASPMLSCEVYRELGGHPPAEHLPTREEYFAHAGRCASDPLEQEPVE